VLAKQPFHVVLKILVLEVCDSLTTLRTFMPRCFGIWSSTWSNGLAESPKIHCVCLLLLACCEVINDPIELRSHLPRVFFIFFLLIIFIYLLAPLGKVADLVLLDVISGLCLLFALFFLAFIFILLRLVSVLVERHLVHLIIKLFLIFVLLVVLERVEGFSLFLHLVIFLLMKRRPPKVLVLVVVQIGALANIQHVRSIHH
jgi:hypothetical protein